MRAIYGEADIASSLRCVIENVPEFSSTHPLPTFFLKKRVNYLIGICRPSHEVCGWVFFFSFFALTLNNSERIIRMAWGIVSIGGCFFELFPYNIFSRGQFLFTWVDLVKSIGLIWARITLLDKAYITAGPKVLSKHFSFLWFYLQFARLEMPKQPHRAARNKKNLPVCILW